MRGVLIRFYLSCYEQEIRDISDFEPPKKNSKSVLWINQVSVSINQTINNLFKKIEPKS